MKDVRLFLSGNLPFKRALVHAFLYGTIWIVCHLLFKQNNYYNTEAWDIYGQNDMRWFYYEVLFMSALFSLPFLLMINLWRCSKNIKIQEQFLLARVILTVVFVVLGAFYVSSLLFIYAFTPS